jgi:hypothetical protein
MRSRANIIMLAPARPPTTLPTTTGVDGADDSSETGLATGESVAATGAGATTGPPAIVPVALEVEEWRELEECRVEIDVVLETTKDKYACDEFDADKVEEILELEKVCDEVLELEITSSIVSDPPCPPSCRTYRLN